MLSGLYRQQFEQFQHGLKQLKATATVANPDKAALQADFLEVQQMFQMRIANPEYVEALDPDVLTRLQSFQTEIDKNLRLLGMDVMFLQSARQVLTAQHRQAQMSDRLNTLLRYCEVLLDDETSG